jgi:putative ABC transport system ATP-binding protein
MALSSVSYTVAEGTTPLPILKDISLSVKSKERVAIVGPSGAGKTSLLMVMAGLEKATAGRVLIDGQDVQAFDEDAAAMFRRQHVGIVFQAFRLIPTLSALDNVAIPLELARQRDAHTTAQAALQRVGLGHRLHHYPTTLSGGEQQRVAIARALVMQPAVILADEPTGNLDHATGQQVMQLLFAQTHAHDTALILVTHDRELAAQCDRTLTLRDGELAAV